MMRVPCQYYNDIEAKKYAVKSAHDAHTAHQPLSTSLVTHAAVLLSFHLLRCLSSRMMEIQTRMAERAIELLSLPPTSPPLHILDIGCGSGLSGEAITEAGHYWTGIDIAPAMLAVALLRDVEGSLILHDIGQGLPFRPASFDGCISVSVLQWLCNADHKDHVPRRRLAAFFTSLFSALKRGAKAVFQCYPETPTQLALMMEAAVKAGFTGGVVVDYPNSTKAKKYFLCLSVGGGGEVPRGLTGDEADQHEADERRTVMVGRVRDRKGGGKGGKAGRERAGVKTKEWIVAKKERQRRQGKTVVADSKYTGRKRKPRF